MRFLTLGALASASAKINDIDTGDMLVAGRIEAYSCKRAGADRKLYNDLEKQYKAELVHSPTESLSVSPFGPMEQKKSRETLIELISTLNASFPDYDFSSLRADHFVKEEQWRVVHQINARLESAIPNYATIRDSLWTAVDSEIQLKECTIYSLMPDLDTNPFEADGCVWSFTYFFYNKKKLKRIILWSCSANWKNDALEVTFEQTQSGEEFFTDDLRNLDADGDFDMEMMMDFSY